MQFAVNLTVVFLTLAGSGEEIKKANLQTKPKRRGQPIVAAADNTPSLKRSTPPQNSRTSPSQSTNTQNRPIVIQTKRPDTAAGIISYSPGFFILNDQYFSDATLSWQNHRVHVENHESAIQAATHRTTPFANPEHVESPDSTSGVEISERQMNSIASTLATGGVVIISEDAQPICADLFAGGREVIAALSVAPGPQRDVLIANAEANGIDMSSESRMWLAAFRPEKKLTAQANEVTRRLRRIESSNMSESNAERRLNQWAYPLTVSAMLIFVFSIGSLLAARPHELVSVANPNSPDAGISVSRFLLLIAVMSAIDLAWTLLAHQAGQMNEINPIGSLILDDPKRVIAFKCLATTLAIGILFRARDVLFARKACWWICLTLSLLTGRWILVAGVSV